MNESALKQWTESPQVRVAVAVSGWPNCSAVDFLQALADVLNEMEDLAEKGIRFPDLVELCSEVWLAEGQAPEGENATEHVTPNSAEAKRAIRKLWLHGYDSAEIAKLTQIEWRKVDAYLDWTRGEYTSRTVVLGHLAGLTVSLLADQCRMSRTRILAILDDAGYKPNLSKTPKADAGLQAQIHGLRSTGLSASVIAKNLGISLDRVKNVLYPRRRS